ncbi:MAG: TlpA family protein disulfide reductase [Acidobacteria bacterium]|nr:TlpA family protein disulfide reductase [Acidobacteriota bacterium]
MDSRPPYFRIGLLFLLLVFVVEWAWMETSSGGKGGPLSRIFSRASSGAKGCPVDGKKGSFGKADFAWQIRSLDGQVQSLDAYKNKVLFVNVWATWCGPCVREMPDIQALYDSLKQDSNVAFLLVSEEEMDDVKKFVAEQKLTAPIYISASKLPDSFESRGIPATFIVDREGNIVHSHVGAANWENDGCRTFLRSLL